MIADDANIGKKYNVKSVEDLNKFKNLTKIGKSAFYGQAPAGDTPQDTSHGAVLEGPIELKYVKEIGDIAFAWQWDVTEILLPAVEKLGKAVFTSSKIKTLSLPLITTISEGALSGASIENLIAPEVTSVEKSGLSGAELTNVDMHKLNSIGDSAFAYSVLHRVPDFAKIKNIGNEAFRACYGPVMNSKDSSDSKESSELAFPGVIEIGKGAFAESMMGTVRLPKVENVPESTFEKAVIDISLPVVKTIGAKAFHDAELSMGSLELPTLEVIEDCIRDCGGKTCDESKFDDVVSFEYSNQCIGAFSGCNVGIYNFKNVKKIGAGAFADYLNNQPEITKLSAPNAESVGESAFVMAKLTDDINLSRVETIGKRAFIEAKLPDDVAFISTKAVGNHAFMGAKGGRIRVPEALTIGDGAFAQASIHTVYAPKATAIGANAFESSAIEKLDAPYAETIGDAAFKNCKKFDTDSWTLQSIKKIGKEAFYGVDHFTQIGSLMMPKLTTIGDSAFAQCTKMTSVILPQAAYVGSKAFEGCEMMSSLTLGSATSAGVSRIGDSAFSGCTTLKNLSVLSSASGTSTTAAASSWTGFNTKACSLVLSGSNYSKADLSSKTWGAATWNSIAKQ